MCQSSTPRLRRIFITLGPQLVSIPVIFDLLARLCSEYRVTMGPRMVIRNYEGEKYGGS